MDQSVKNIIIDLITPICFILLAVFLRPYLSTFPITQTHVFAYFPLALLAISLLASWKFNQVESFYLSLILTASYAGILVTQQHIEVNPTFHTGNYITLIAIALPLNFIFFKILPTATIFSFSGAFRLSFISAQSYGVYWAMSNQYTHLFELINISFWPDAIPLFSAMPQAAVLLFFVAILAQIAYVIIHQQPLDSTLLGTLILLLIAFNLKDNAFIFFSAFSAAAIMLTVATIQSLYNMAFIDTLTRLPSRRAMENEMKKLGKRYSIAMLDIDHFKNINDTYGHDVGDQVLQMVAKHIRRIGGGGRPARYGGEEFVIIFPGKTLIDAKPWLEIVRDNIEHAHFSLRGQDRPKKEPKMRNKRGVAAKEISVTISIGIAERIRTQKTPSAVTKSADEALYKAKKNGRNRLCY